MKHPCDMAVLLNSISSNFLTLANNFGTVWARNFIFDCGAMYRALLYSVWLSSITTYKGVNDNDAYEKLGQK